jgi:hypothetical protein
MTEAEIKVDKIVAEFRAELLHAIGRKIIGRAVATVNLSQGGINDVSIGTDRKLQSLK